MNPETKLTHEQIKAICAKHEIDYVSHQRINTGFSHEVHRLNKDLVIKIYDAESSKSFETEAAMLGLDITFPKPQLIATGTDEDTGRYYILMTYVPGWSLGSRWHLANDKQREKLIKDICQALKTINQIDPKLIGADESVSWQQTMTEACSKLVDKLVARGIITEEVATQTKRAIDHYSPALVGSKQYVVFWDIHFDNFIVNEAFKLQAIIDLESTSLASLDYPIFVLQKMTDLPNKYLREDEEQFADVKDYVHLKEWYQKYYPEMFNFDNLDTRLKFYQLRDVLHLLQDWSKNEENHTELTRLINGY